MRPSIPLLVFGACLMLGPASAHAANGTPEPKNADAVIADDKAWGAAETRGDVAFVDQLLLPQYQTVGPAGIARGKDAVLAATRKHADNPGAAKTTEDWKASHPYRGDVVITGDTAVITWILTAPDKGEPVMSCDVFTYVDGRWKAIYSQHTTAGN